jgi:hypothetical protein
MWALLQAAAAAGWVPMTHSLSQRSLLLPLLLLLLVLSLLHLLLPPSTV